jgi:phytoene/squalene synthetase
MTTVTEALSGKAHGDENFPVASWLLSDQNRGPILAFYRFARAADDVADHPTLRSRSAHPRGRTFASRAERA